MNYCQYVNVLQPLIATILLHDFGFWKYTTQNVEDLLIFWQTLQLPSSGLLILWIFGISCRDLAVGRGWKVESLWKKLKCGVLSNRGDHVVEKRRFKDFFLRCDGHQEG
jgi:hypothetical protein